LTSINAGGVAPGPRRSRTDRAPHRCHASSVAIHSRE
jgi:hypothetical protein